MLPAKISLICPVVLEKKSFECFLPVYDPTEMILAILYREVPCMVPAKYQPYRPGGSGEEDFLMFLLYIGMAAILNFGSKLFLLFIVRPTP